MHPRVWPYANNTIEKPKSFGLIAFYAKENQRKTPYMGQIVVR